MNRLELNQQLFYDALFDQKPNSLNFIHSTDAFERLKIYKHTIFENLRQALAITYPGIWVLLGEECANSFAYAFITFKKNLPLTGNLDEWGEGFPDFLADQTELSNLLYIKQYGHYEWLKHLAYGQLEAESLDYSDLINLSEQNIEESVLKFIPSLYLFKSEYSLDKIQEIIDNPNADSIKLENLPSYAIIARPENSVITLWVSEEYYIFFENLRRGLALGKVIQKITDLYSNFDLASMIHFLISYMLIEKTDITIL
jgi:hypothetical protein